MKRGNSGLEIAMLACYMAIGFCALSFLNSLRLLPMLSSIQYPMGNSTIVVEKITVQAAWFLAMSIVHGLPTVVLLFFSGMARALTDIEKNTHQSFMVLSRMKVQKKGSIEL